MKTLLIAALAISVLLGVVSGYAATAKTKADCSAQAQAHNLIGDVHDSFMKMCMDPTYASASQQQKMMKCHTQAAAQDFKGDALKQFMSTCMRQ
jgi:hypothetical protein